MIKRNIYKLLLVILLVMLTGCKAGQKDQLEETSKSKTTTAGLNPLGLEGDNRIIPMEYPKTGNLIGQPVVTDTSVNFTLDSLANTVASGIDSLNSQVFRIQLFSTKLFGEGRKTVRVAEEIFDQPIYLDYEVPYYKIRVGDFADREKAEKYLLRVRSSGYTDAWVVAVNVSVKQTEPLYQDSLLNKIFPNPDENQDVESED